MYNTVNMYIFHFTRARAHTRIPGPIRVKAVMRAIYSFCYMLFSIRSAKNDAEEKAKLPPGWEKKLDPKGFVFWV